MGPQISQLSNIFSRVGLFLKDVATSASSRESYHLLWIDF